MTRGDPTVSFSLESAVGVPLWSPTGLFLTGSSCVLGFFVVLRKSKDCIMENLPFRSCNGGGTSLVAQWLTPFPLQGPQVQSPSGNWIPHVATKTEDFMCHN